MTVVSRKSGSFTVNAFVGDAKTLLAFNLSKADSKGLAGFTIKVQPGDKEPYYLLNQLQFEKGSQHAQDPSLPANSTFNSPIHKFRWLHVPGSAHQGLKPFYGPYTYTVTPRYCSPDGALLPIDNGRSLSLKVDVMPFSKGRLSLGFTRGFVQSQAFVHHFGPKAHIVPPGKPLDFDTTAEAGRNARGQAYSYDQEYNWLGFTAQDRIFDILDEVLADRSLRLDVFAYDLGEPYIAAALLKLAAQKRVRVILDNAALHVGKDGKPTSEDTFAKAFARADKASIKRGHFGRYSHDKVLIVSDRKIEGPDGARKVLTGSTNFSITGLYVNSNHVVVYDDPKVAGTYAEVFEAAWDGDVRTAAFLRTPLSQKPYDFGGRGVPDTTITFSPHTAEVADEILGGLVKRVEAEGRKKAGNVLFAVMELGGGSNSTVYKALNALHARQDIFSFGISDDPQGISLYKPGVKRGLLVTGTPAGTRLPPPFDQVPSVKSAGAGHQVHHKFVVCGFRSDDAVVYCGSSNLANKGETVNGDNLLAIHDTDVATAFAIEAIGLVDHFNFLNRYRSESKANTGTTPKAAPASLKEAAVEAGWHLPTGDGWVKSYYDPNDMHCADRELFG